MDATRVASLEQGSLKLATKPIENATDRCTAYTSSSGHTERCKRRPIRGGTVCDSHGGRLPNVIRTANERLVRSDAQRQALKRMRDRTGKSTIDVLQEMERLADEVTVFKDVAREAVEELLEAGKGLGYESKAGEQTRAAVSVYEKALDRCEKVLASCFKLGLADRRAKIQEAEMQLLLLAIRNILNRLELTEHQQMLAISAVPEELRAVAAEPDVIEGEIVG